MTTHDTRLDVADDPGGDGATPFWDLKLYVAGQSPKCLAAIANLRRICDEHLAGRHKIEVIDLQQNPQLARDDQIVAIPTLVRKLPAPVRKTIGDLSNTERVMIAFDIHPGAAEAP